LPQASRDARDDKGERDAPIRCDGCNDSLGEGDAFPGIAWWLKVIRDQTEMTLCKLEMQGRGRRGCGRPAPGGRRTGPYRRCKTQRDQSPHWGRRPSPALPPARCTPDREAEAGQSARWAECGRWSTARRTTPSCIPLFPQLPRRLATRTLTRGRPSPQKTSSRGPSRPSLHPVRGRPNCPEPWEPRSVFHCHPA